MPQHFRCETGCSGCCHGLFEITSLDVPLLEQGLASLSPEARRLVVARAREVMERNPHPFDLADWPEGAREALFDQTEEVACPLLDDAGGCRIYRFRPLMCRTFGLPIREGNRYIGDECELNFRRAEAWEKRRAAWDLEDEVEAGAPDELTIPAAILLVASLAEPGSQFAEVPGEPEQVGIEGDLGDRARTRDGDGAES